MPCLKQNQRQRFGSRHSRRVSTPKQEKEGESLATQTKFIKDTAKRLEGTIVAWYGGQEHGTPGYEKEEFERLVSDASTGRFNAVIVFEIKRWSRDVENSKRAFNVFRRHGIRFFVLAKEYDIHDPTDNFMLDVHASIGGYFASIQKQHSILNRIERAKRGLPVCGKLPFGRTFDKKAEQWGVDDAKKKTIEDVARCYLDGESLITLAAEMGMNNANLHFVLKHRCGDEWPQTFKVEEFRIDEEVPTKVPRLLPEKVIQAIRRGQRPIAPTRIAKPQESICSPAWSSAANAVEP